MPILNHIVGSLQRTISRSQAGGGAAVKLKRQADSIIGLRCSSGIAHESNGEAWLARLVAPESKFFVDVGANLGAWSFLFASEMKAVPRGLLFEPAPHTAQKLRETVGARAAGGFEVIASAVSDRSGFAAFQAEANFGETSSLVAQHSRPGATTVEVPVTTLDIELSKRDLPHIDFLKIDAEGYDLHVLLGAKSYVERQRIKIIQFEYNHPWAAAGSTLLGAYQFLQSHGYKVRLLKAEGLFTLDPNRTGEYFRYSNFIAYCPGPSGDLIETQRHPTLF